MERVNLSDDYQWKLIQICTEGDNYDRIHWTSGHRTEDWSFAIDVEHIVEDALVLWVHYQMKHEWLDDLVLLPANRLPTAEEVERVLAHFGDWED